MPNLHQVQKGNYPWYLSAATCKIVFVAITSILRILGSSCLKTFFDNVMYDVVESQLFFYISIIFGLISCECTSKKVFTTNAKLHNCYKVIVFLFPKCPLATTCTCLLLSFRKTSEELEQKEEQKNIPWKSGRSDG